MSENPEIPRPWSDEFSRVADPGTNVPASRYGASFQAQIHGLGADGFAQWLTNSFCKGSGYREPGYFHCGSDPGDGDDGFSYYFYLAVPSFNQETVALAREGVAKAVEGIDPQKISLPGVIEMVEISAQLGMREQYDALAPILRAKYAETFPPQGRQLSPG